MLKMFYGLVLFIILLNLCTFCVAVQDNSKPTQPAWTVQQNKTLKFVEKVRVNSKNLKETARIRDEIEDAIEQGRYAVGRTNESDIVKEANELLGANFRVSQHISDLLGISFKFDIFDNHDSDDVLPNHKISDAGILEIKPNKIDSAFGPKGYNGYDDDDDNHHYHHTFDNVFDYRQSDYSIKHITREELKLSLIVEDLSFEFGENVSEWRTFDRFINNKRMLIGREPKSLIFVEETDGKWKFIKKLDLEDPPISLETFCSWNSASRIIDGFLLIASSNKISWLNVNGFHVVWELNIHATVTAMKILEINNYNYLVAVAGNANGVYSSIYQFDLSTKEAHLQQAIQLKISCNHFVFLDTGFEAVLAFPQKNSIEIFACELHSNGHPHFDNIIQIKSDSIKMISGFQMGGYSYLAIAGDESQILRYYRGEFFPQTILSSSFGDVNMFLPIPARTYRDDMILLIQHQINFESHYLTVVEALIWDGEAFEPTLSTSCQIDNVIYPVGVACLIDPDRDQGIDGTAIISKDDNIVLVVPREQAPSGLFNLFIELIPRANEEDYLKSMLIYIKDMVEDQKEVLKEAQELLDEFGNDDFSDFNVIDPLQIEYLQANELIFNGNVDQIFINNHEWNSDDFEIDIDQLLDELGEFGKQVIDYEITSHESDENGIFVEPSESIINYQVIQPKESIQAVPSIHLIGKRDASNENFQVDNVKVKKLFVESVNGIPIEDIMFIKDQEIDHNGTIIFESSVNVTVHLNIFDTAMLRAKQETIKVDNLLIDGNLKFDRVNGLLWKDLLKNTVFLDEPSDIEELQVFGKVAFNDDLEIKTLNGLRYPKQFLLSNGPDQSIITGEKRFNNILNTNAMDCEGFINDINPFDLITLYDPQNISGLTTFSRIEVTEALEINGTISGKYMNEFLPNPTLLHTKHVKSACFFKHLEVLGEIYAKGIFNGVDFDMLLSDILYTTENDIKINSLKSFKYLKVENDIHLTSNLINDMSLYDFFTKNTPQILNISELSGNLYFGDLSLTGLYDFVNVTELDINTIKKFGEQYTNAELIIENVSNTEAGNLRILKTLNQVPIGSYCNINSPEIGIALKSAEFVWNLTLDNLEVENKGHITGNGLLNSMDLNDFESKRISVNRDDQRILSDCHIKNAYIRADVTTKTVNGFNADMLLKFFSEFHDIPKMIQNCEVIVDKFNVIGDVLLNKLNDRNFDEIIENAIFLNRPNEIQGDIEFIDQITIDGDVIVEGLLNDRNFDEFVHALFLRSDKASIISSAKKFTAPIKVMDQTEIDSINKISFERIANKNTPLTFDGNLNINGNLLVEKLTVGGYFNDYDTRNFDDTFYRYDGNEDMYYFGESEIHFVDQVYVEHMNIYGSYHDVLNFDDFLKTLVYKNASYEITGKKIFTNATKFANYVNINYFNGLNLKEFLQNVVYINDSRTIEISGPVAFAQLIRANYALVNGNVSTINLMGCNIYEWIQNVLCTDLNITVPIRMTFYPGTLNGNSLNALHLNSNPLSDVITLHTQQNLSGNFQFSEIYLKEQIRVDGTFNSIDIARERNNTLMIYGNQLITTATTMQEVRVLRNLQTLTPINGKDLRYVATLKEDLELRSPVYFKYVEVDSLYTNDTISGFNFIDWYENSLWTCKRAKQVVTGNWTINKLIVPDSLKGNQIINGVPINYFAKQLDNLNSDSNPLNQFFTKEYNIVCTELHKLIKISQTRTYFLRYFDFEFEINLEYPVNTFLLFDYLQDKYMIVNNNCNSTIYKWSPTDVEFIELYNVKTGNLHQILAVPSIDDSLFVVTSEGTNYNNCQILGSNIWKFDANEMIFFANLGGPGEYVDVHYRTPYRGVFYAINKQSETVVEMNIETGAKRTWKLPLYETDNFRFIPPDANLGIALSNGRQIYIVGSSEGQSMRHKRFFPIEIQNYAENLNTKCPASPEYDADQQIESRNIFNKYDIDNFGQECNLQKIIMSPVRVKSKSSIGSQECENCFGPQIKNAVNKVVVGLVNDLELVKSETVQSDQDVSSASQYDYIDFENGVNKRENQRTSTDIDGINKKGNERLSPTRLAMNYEKFQRFSKKVVSKLYHAFHEIRDIHKAIDRVRGTGHNYVSQPFNQSLVHESLSAPNKHEYQIERPTLHTITEILHILNSGRKHIEFTIHDFPLNDAHGSAEFDPNENGNVELINEKYQNVEETVHEIVRNLLDKLDELVEIEQSETKLVAGYNIVDKPNRMADSDSDKKSEILNINTTPVVSNYLTIGDINSTILPSETAKPGNFDGGDDKNNKLLKINSNLTSEITPTIFNSTTHSLNHDPLTPSEGKLAITLNTNTTPSNSPESKFIANIVGMDYKHAAPTATTTKYTIYPTSKPYFNGSGLNSPTPIKTKFNNGVEGKLKNRLNNVEENKLDIDRDNGITTSANTDFHSTTIHDTVYTNLGDSRGEESDFKSTTHIQSIDVDEHFISELSKNVKIDSTTRNSDKQLLEKHTYGRNFEPKSSSFGRIGEKQDSKILGELNNPAELSTNRELPSRMINIEEALSSTIISETTKLSLAENINVSKQFASNSMLKAVKLDPDDQRILDQLRSTKTYTTQTSDSTQIVSTTNLGEQFVLKQLPENNKSNSNAQINVGLSHLVNNDRFSTIDSTTTPTTIYVGEQLTSKSLFENDQSDSNNQQTILSELDLTDTGTISSDTVTSSPKGYSEGFSSKLLSKNDKYNLNDKTILRQLDLIHTDSIGVNDILTTAYTITVGEQFTTKPLFMKGNSNLNDPKVQSPLHFANTDKVAVGNVITTPSTIDVNKQFTFAATLEKSELGPSSRGRLNESNWTNSSAKIASNSTTLSAVENVAEIVTSAPLPKENKSKSKDQRMQNELGLTNTDSIGRNDSTKLPESENVGEQIINTEVRENSKLESSTAENLYLDTELTLFSTFSTHFHIGEDLENATLINFISDSVINPTMSKKKKIGSNIFTNASGSDIKVTSTEISSNEKSPEPVTLSMHPEENALERPTEINIDEFWEDENNIEPIIGQQYIGDEYLVADNTNFPSSNSGEVIILEVGPRNNRRKLVAVTELKEPAVSGEHDAIRIYFDILEGNLFQTILASKPRSPTSLHWRDETVLAFIENNHSIRIFNYRGTKGFVEIAKHHTDEPIASLGSTTLKIIGNNYELCPKQYLIITVGRNIQFYEAIMGGSCGINANFECQD